MPQTRPRQPCNGPQPSRRRIMPRCIVLAIIGMLVVVVPADAEGAELVEVKVDGTTKEATSVIQQAAQALNDGITELDWAQRQVESAQERVAASTPGSQDWHMATRELDRQKAVLAKAIADRASVTGPQLKAAELQTRKLLRQSLANRDTFRSLVGAALQGTNDVTLMVLAAHRKVKNAQEHVEAAAAVASVSSLTLGVRELDTVLAYRLKVSTGSDAGSSLDIFGEGDAVQGSTAPSATRPLTDLNDLL
jgi:hypothetical protein